MRYWLSYDLGLQGNYEALYEWLDKRQAREYGDSVATFASDLSADDIKRELTNILKMNPRARVYLLEDRNGAAAGKFIVGRRKRAPWSGYALDFVEDEDAA